MTSYMQIVTKCIYPNYLVNNSYEYILWMTDKSTSKYKECRHLLTSLSRHIVYSDIRYGFCNRNLIKTYYVVATYYFNHLFYQYQIKFCIHIKIKY